MRRIKMILAVTAAMATLLAMAAAPAVANDWKGDRDDGCIGVVSGGECIGVGSVDRWDGWDGRSHLWDNSWGHHRGNEWGFAASDFDDCFWWDGELFCEVDF